STCHRALHSFPTRRSSDLGYQTSLVFYRKYNLGQDVFTLPKALHEAICRPLKNTRPTIGYMALASLLEADFSELYITGFTFYRTDRKSTRLNSSHVKISYA